MTFLRIFFESFGLFLTLKIDLENQVLVFLTGIFGHLTIVKTKSGLQFEIFLSNSVKMMKNLFLLSKQKTKNTKLIFRETHYSLRKCVKFGRQFDLHCEI